jgi:hypothetical protein
MNPDPSFAVSVLQTGTTKYRAGLRISGVCTNLPLATKLFDFQQRSAFADLHLCLGAQATSASPRRLE